MLNKSYRNICSEWRGEFKYVVKFHSSELEILHIKQDKLNIFIIQFIKFVSGGNTIFNFTYSVPYNANFINIFLVLIIILHER